MKYIFIRWEILSCVQRSKTCSMSRSYFFSISWHTKHRRQPNEESAFMSSFSKRFYLIHYSCKVQSLTSIFFVFLLPKMRRFCDSESLKARSMNFQRPARPVRALTDMQRKDVNAVPHHITALLHLIISTHVWNNVFDMSGCVRVQMCQDERHHRWTKRN